MSLVLAAALALLVATFALTWVFARRVDNYGVVDVAWSYAFGALAVGLAASLGGWPPRVWLMAAMVALWSLRLGTHLAVRVRSHHPAEDTRYVEMRRRWAPAVGQRMFWFFQMQALSVLLLSAPFILVARDAGPGFSWLHAAGVAVWLAGLVGESIADGQLRAFAALPENRGRVCNSGLWKFSRHPNYFFEWTIWVGYALFALPSPYGWVGLVAPAIILHLLLNVTGIPLTEEQSVRRRGDAYRRYQAVTSPFFPWPPTGSSDA